MLIIGKRKGKAGEGAHSLREGKLPDLERTQLEFGKSLQV